MTNLTQHSFRLRKADIDAMQAYAAKMRMPFSSLIRNAWQLYVKERSLPAGQSLAITKRGSVWQKIRSYVPAAELDVACVQYSFRVPKDVLAAMKEFPDSDIKHLRFWQVNAAAWGLYKLAYSSAINHTLAVVDAKGRVVEYVLIKT